MTVVFVTGGSGFVGGRLVSRLLKDGHTVRGLARGDASAARIEALGATPVRGDLGDAGALREAMAGAELVFHAAARTTRGGGRARFWADNVEGTANVLRAAGEAGVRRLVHVGTEASLMNGRPLVRVDETAPLRPDSRADYAASKAAAEQLVRDARDLETVVLRPRFVWGAGDTTVLPELVAMVRGGRFAWIGGGLHHTDTTHVDNAVEGLVLAAERGRPGEAYFVTDGRPAVFRDFVTELLATRRVTPPRRSLPLGAALALAAAGETLWRWLPLPGAPPLDHLSVWLAGMECTIDIGKAAAELGYRPVRDRREGMAELRAQPWK
ncbi:NAD-dependent epimerase/dehydratase family protein [Nonomuraea sp. PA05]|uniref:NAD-dependent epimerase/dehydratase family protein n=1 Tax=Nonomuraea sp. PA05 TaxID=2604466 RepID=UPI0011D8EAD0|nr:NAD-dependent epimerase/dehydratase family protein [Nonomuraea sp. PA05]TYB66085.1 NAD-dependent epimerase/dehydratase family protein [Nonomuraea sp. PA05]